MSGKSCPGNCPCGVTLYEPYTRPLSLLSLLGR